MLDPETNAAFLNAIREAPADDAPRLIYADWLDEMGEEERAEFIRGQMRLRTMSPTDADYPKLHRRVGVLQQEHGIAWMADYPHRAGVHWEVWDRGFISAVRFENPDLFRRWADEIFIAAPITELRLHQFYWQDAQRLAESPHLRHIEILDLEDGNRVGNAGVSALMDSPYLTNLRELKLRGNALGSAAARAVAQAPSMNKLQVLDLQRNDLYDEGVRAIAESAILAQLRRLDLDRTRTSDAGVGHLADSRYLRQLQSLSLSGNFIGDVGATALANSAILDHVLHLFLQANQVGPVGAEALAQSTHMNALQNLFLRQNRLRDAGAMVFVTSPLVETIRQLYIGENNISDLVADQLRRVYGSRVTVY